MIMSSNHSRSRTAATEAANAVLGGVAVSVELTQRLISECIASLSSIPARQHPLGFLHLNLSEISGVEGARLHIWTPTFQAKVDELGRLHDHSWELHSSVLTGSLIDFNFRPVQTLEGPYTAHRVRYGEKANTLEPVYGQWRLEETNARELRQGALYSLMPRLVHLTKITATPTATFLLALDRGGPGPTVYTPFGVRNAEAAERPAVSCAKAREALCEIEDALRTVK